MLYRKPGEAYPDLGAIGWNDRISSVICSPGAQTSYCVLWEDINYFGSSIWIPRGTYYPDLHIYGWGDRASSLIVYLQ